MSSLLSKPKLSIAVVTRETRLAGLRARFNNERQAKFYVQQAVKHDVQRRKKGASEKELNEAADEAFEEYIEEDRAYTDAIQHVTRELDFGLPVRSVDRGFLPNFDFFTAAVVVVIGQDGLVANTAKYVGDLPIVAVNPDPERIDGVLLPWGVRDAPKVVKRSLDGAAKTRPVTLAEASLNDGQRLLAFNDLFIGAQTHVSARYVLRSGGQEESQSSSGVLVSTGAGSTGWVSSVFNMARAVTAFRGAAAPEGMRLPWEDRRLLWVVREPFASRHSGAELAAGLLDEGAELVLESQMPAGGVIFSDGVESDALQFNSGAIARIRASEQRARLVVP
jgi:NAD kinase